MNNGDTDAKSKQSHYHPIEHIEGEYQYINILVFSPDEFRNDNEENEYEKKFLPESKPPKGGIPRSRNPPGHYRHKERMEWEESYENENEPLTKFLQHGDSVQCHPMPKKRILVTGGAGFIGSNFCNAHSEAYDIIALDNLLLGDQQHLSPSVKFVEGDAANRETLDALGQFDYIVHFAGTSSAPMFHKDIVDSYRNSILSFLEVLEYANRSGAKKVLFASTSSLYGNTTPPLTEDQPPVPTNHYSVTKIAMENISVCYHHTHPALEIIGFRFMSVYGPHEEHKGVYANLISQFVWGMMRNEQPIIYGDGTQTRDFTNVIDVVQGITLAMETDKHIGNDIFNIGTGTPLAVLELVRVINKVIGTEIKPRHIENPVTENYIRTQQADITKIQSTLGFAQSISLEDGIRHLVEEHRNKNQKSTRNRTHEANAIPKKGPP